MLGAGPVGVEMAQAVPRMGALVAIVEGMDHLLREPRPLGEALGEALGARIVRARMHASAARRDGDDYVVESPTAARRGDRLLVATGRRRAPTASASKT